MPKIYTYRFPLKSYFVVLLLVLYTHSYGANENLPKVSIDEKEYIDEKCLEELREDAFTVPTASNLSMAGVMEEGFTLEVFFDFFDADGDLEGAHQYQWYTHPNEFSTPGAGTVIPGATGKTYTIPLDNTIEGLHISVIVTPVDDNGEVGIPVEYMDWSPTKSNPVLNVASSCFLAGGVGTVAPDNGFQTVEPLCSPRNSDWRIKYTGIDYRYTNLPVIIVDWGDGNVENFFPTLLNPNETKMGLQEWEVIANHVYDFDGGSAAPVDGSCTYELTTAYGVFAGGNVNLACPSVPAQKYTVWDDISNTDLGGHDIGHDVSTTGNEVGETVEVCAGDNGVIRLEDQSGFNCRVAIEPDNPNQDSRWIQWVYGTTSTITTGVGATEKIIIKGVSYDNTDFPLYGTPMQQQNTPPGVLGPNGITDNIQMPTTAVDGEIFIVTLRSWNTCNPFSAADDLSPLQGIGFDNFQYYGPGGTNQLPLVGLATDFANDDPIVLDFPISIVASPTIPVAIDNVTCNGILPLAEVSAASIDVGATAVNFYNSDPTLGAATLLQSSLSTTYAPGTHASDPVMDVNVAAQRTYWVTQVGAVGPPACESLPVEVEVTIREDLIIDPITYDTGVDPICAGTTGLTFSLANAAVTETVGGPTNYSWSTTAGLNIIGSSTAQSITVDVDAGATDGIQTISVIRSYSDLSPACDSPLMTYDIQVDAISDGGTLSGGISPICEGESTGNISVTGNTGGVVRWERQKDGGGFVDLGAAFVGLTTINQTLTVSGTYDYRLVAKNGVCSEDLSSNVISIVVNDKPSLANLSGTTDICQGDNADLNIAITDGTAPYNVTIDNGIGVIVWSSSADDPSISPATTTTYTITSVTDANGCTPTSITGSAIISVTNPTDAVFGGDASICNLDDTDLTVTITGGKSPYDITITDDQVSSPNLGTINNYISGSNINTSALTTTTTYTLSAVFDADGCPVLGISDNEVVVNVGVALSGATLNVTDICDGEDFIFSVDINDGAPLYTVDYTVDGNPATENNYVSGADINLGILAIGTHPVAITQIIDACGSSTGALGAQNIEVSALPTANDQAPIICSDVALDNTATVDLTSQHPSINGAAVTYTWYENNGPLSNPIAAPTSYTVTDGVAIFVEVDDGTCTDVATVTYTINPRPVDPKDPVRGMACSSDLTGAIISVDNPGSGNLIVWYEDPGGVTPASGVTSGSRDRAFTPTSNATFTYYAITESQTAPTNCESLNALAVEHIQDLLPTIADADLDDDTSLLETCTDELLLGATPADNNGTGTWSYPGLLFYEDFNGLSDGATESLGMFGWSRDITGVTFNNNDHFEVRSNAFVGNDTDSVAIWISATIDISTTTNFMISMDALGIDTEVQDSIQLSYQIDANPEEVVGTLYDDFTSSTISGTFATGGGTSLVIRVRVDNSSEEEFLSFDNIIVLDDAATVLSFDNIHDENATVSGLPVGTTTLTWSVSSEFGTCDPSTQNVNVIRNPLPVANDITPALCEDVPMNSDIVTGVDLTIPSYNDAITGIVGSVNRTIAYFDDPSRMPANAIPDPTNVDISDAEIIYVRVADTGTSPFTSCTSESEITFTVNTLPTTVDIDDATTTFCEDAFGSNKHAGIDLETTYDLAVANGDLTDRNVTWYLGYNAVTQIFSSPVVVGAAAGETQNFEVTDGLTIFAEVENTITNCVDVAQVDFTVNPLPTANPIEVNGGVAPDPSIFCSSTGLILFQVDDAANVGSTYQWSASDPAKIQILGGTTNSFVIVILNTAISLADGEFLQVIETTADNCAGSPTQVQLVVSDAPAAPTINGDIDACTNQTGVVYTVVPANPTSTYTWTIPVGASISGITDGSSITVNFGASLGGNIGVKETNDIGCTSPDAIPLAVTLHGRPVLSPSLDATVCSDDVAGITFASTGVPPLATHYQINSVFVTPGLLEDAGNIAKNGTSHMNVAANFIAGDRFRNLTATDLAVVYTVVPTTEDPATLFCDGTPVNVTLTVRPEPYLSNSLSATVCSQEVAGLEMEEQPGSVDATLFHYTAVNTNGLTPGGGNATIPSTGGFPAGAAFDYVKNDTYTNLTGAAVVVEYTVIPISADGCESTAAVPIIVLLTVDPEPVGSDITRPSECSNVGFSVSPDNITNGVAVAIGDFSWVRNPLPAGLVEIVAGTGTGMIAETLKNETSGSLNAAYVVTSISGANCTSSTTYTVTIPIDPEPVGSDITRPSECSNTGFSVSPSNITNGVAVATLDFSWVRNALPAGLVEIVAGTGTGMIAETLENKTSGPLSAEYVVTATSGAGCTGITYTVTIPIDPEPLGSGIIRPAECSNTGFSVSPDNITNGVAVAIGDFSWVRNALPAGLVEIVAGTGIGMIAETLENKTSVPLNAEYVVTPTSGAGCTSSTTYAVIIPINPEPVGSDITRPAECSNVGFSVSPNNITNGVAVVIGDFSWVRNALPAGLVEIVAGTSTGMIAETLENQTSGSLNAEYVVTSTSGAGCTGITYTVTIPIDPEPLGSGIIRPAECSNVGFSVSPDNITNGVAVAIGDFSWVRSALPAGLVEIAAGTGTGMITETLENQTSGPLNAAYVVTATSGAGCTSTPYTVTVPVDPEPVGSDIIRPAECSNVGFSVNPDNITNGVAVATLDFSWVRNALPVGLVEIVAGTGTGMIAETLENKTSVQLSVEYVVTSTSGVGCTSSTTYMVTIPIDPEPVGSDMIGSAECSNVGFSVSPENIINGMVVAIGDFSWVRNALPAGLVEIAAGTGTGMIAETLENQTSGSLNAEYVVTPTSGAGCTSSTTYTVTIPIDPEPVGVDITRPSECSNVGFSVSPDNITNGVAVATLDFSWVRNALPAGLVEIAAGTGTGMITETLENKTSVPLDAEYIVTATSGAGCMSSTTYIVTVPIDPEPVGSDITRLAECSNVAFSVSPDNITNGVIVAIGDFSWVRNALPAGLVEIAAGTGTGMIAETLENKTSVSLNAEYVVTTTSGAGCTGITYIVTIPIDPEPLGSGIIRPSECSNAGFSVSPDNITNGVAVAIVDFSWVRNALPAGLVEIAAGTGTGMIAETFENKTSGSLNAAYVVTATSGANCTGATYTVIIPINPEPVGVDITRPAECSNVGFSVSPNNITNGVAVAIGDFSWVRNVLPAGLIEIAAGTGTGMIAETLENQTSGPLNAEYVVTATSGVGCTSSTTYTVIIPINPEPVGVDITRSAECSNVGFSVSPENITNGIVVAIGDFSWVRSTLPAGLVEIVAGTGTDMIAETLENKTSGSLNAEYVVTAISGTGCTSSTTYTVTIPIDPEPVGSDIIRPAECSNVGFSIDPGNIINGVAVAIGDFTWVRSTLPAGLVEIVAGTGTGMIAETLENQTSGSLNAAYVVTATSGAGCTSSTTYTVTIPIDPEPVGVDITRPAECSNVGFSVSPDNITNGIAVAIGDFSWVRNALPAGLVEIAAGTGTGMITETLENKTSSQLNAEYVVTSISGVNCTSSTPYTVTIPINPEPVGSNDVNVAYDKCSGDALSYDLQTLNIDGLGNSLLSTFTYTVISTNPSYVVGTNDRTVKGTGPILDNYTNITGGDVNVQYTITPFDFVTGCQGTDFIVDFVIYSEPVGTADAVTVCSDEALNYNIQTANIDLGNGVISDFTYTVSSNNALVNPEPNRTVKSALPITYTYTNTSNLDAEITYTITPISQAHNCIGTPFDVVFTIQPEPKGADFSNTECGGITLNHDLNTNITNGMDSKFYYTVNSNNGGVPAGPDRIFGLASDANITDSYLNNTATDAVITYAVIPIDKLTNCAGNAFSVVFTIQPGPEGVADLELACSNVALNYDIQADNISNGGNNVSGKFTYTVSSANSGAVPEEADRVIASTLPITHTYVNTTGGSVDVTYTITPEGFGAGCVGSPFDVIFRINPEPLIKPISETICSGDTPSINVSSSNFGIGQVDYTYEVTDISGTVVGVVLGDNGSTTTIPHTITNTSSAQAIVTYTYTPTENVNNGCVGEAFDVLITVNPEPVGTPTVLANVCSGEAININPDAFIANLAGNTFTWTAIYNGANGGVGAGVGAISETLTNTTLSISNVEYDIIPTSVGGCLGASFKITIPIDPAPALEIPAILPAPVCSDIAIGYQLTTEATSVAADSYNIISVSPDVGLTPVVITSGIGLTDMAIFNDRYINTGNVQLSVTYTIVPITAAGCEGQAKSITFGVTPAPVFETDLDNVVCSDAPIFINLTIDAASIVATDYRIESMVATGLTENPGNQVKTTDGFPLNITVADINILSGDIFTNNSNNPIDVVYEVTPLNGTCEGATKFITATIEPEITFLNPGDKEICSGQAVGLVLDSDTNPTNGGIIFDYVMLAPLLSPASSSGSDLGQGHAIADVLVNNTNTVQTAVYEVFKYAAESAANGMGCDNGGVSEFITISVDPVPSMDLVGTQTICSGETVSIQLTSPTVLPAPYVVDFELSEDADYAGGNVTSSTPLLMGQTYSANDFLEDNLTNNTNTVQVVTYKLIPRNNRDLTDCTGNEVKITVNVNPTPSGFTIDPVDPQCAEGIYVVTFNFPVGQAPFRFDYEVRDKASNTLITGESDKIAGATGVAVINGIDHAIISDITVILTRVEYGLSSPICSVSGVLATQDITISTPDATFSPDTGFDAVCNTPGLVEFDFAVDPNVIYTWNWGDGSAEEVIDGNTATSPISHQYTNPSFSDFSYNAFLIVESKTVDGCVKFNEQSVVIYPDVLPIIFAFKEEICSGDEIQMLNSSIGAEAHNWYYEVVGFGDFHDQDQAVEEASFTFTNSSDPNHATFAYANPQEFIIHYQGSKDNGNGDVCTTNPSDTDTQYSVMVYKELDVNFDTDDGGRTYSLTAGSVEVGFINSSSPVNDSDFSYDWNYGNGIVTQNYEPESQVYTIAKNYDVTHTITNTVAIDDGVQCSSSETITITVDEDPIIADFKIDITEGCVPTVFTITNNTIGAANQFTWRVYDGANVAFGTIQPAFLEGGVINPEAKEFSFTIFNSGIYTVELVAENVQSSQSETKLITDLINVYDAPVASFDKRPREVVYVPDDEVTVFNFTSVNGDTNVDEYGRPRTLEWLWDFGDGFGNTFDTQDAIYTYDRVSEDELGGVFWISLTASYDYGEISCSNTAVDSIRAELGGNIKTPNAFTPDLSGPSGGTVSGNDNEDNDVFLPLIDGLAIEDGSFSMQIYDRWGVLVFESTDANIGWDGYHRNGKIMPQGVYVYKLVLRLVNGEREVRIGDITLLK